VQELSTATRRANLEAMADRHLDVLVIGGGITGAGVALDAVSRGLSVALVEREDFAWGTSGRSSRLVHGGIRYLRHGEVGLVRESLRERELLRRLAPHLVRPLPFLTPTPRRRQRVYVGLGLALYDGIAMGRTIAGHRRVGPSETARLAPTLRRRSPGYLSYDCRTDDARLTLEVLRQAALRGALVANHAEAETLGRQGAVRGAEVRDDVTGERLAIRARCVVNATGAWADRLHPPDAPRSLRLRPSRGIHLVLDRGRMPIRSAVMVPSIAGDGSLVFVVPWGPRVYAGTTDALHRGSLDRPQVEPEDVRLVLESLSGSFEGDITAADVVASWAGIRPLLDTGRGATRDLSRRHVVLVGPPGLITVTGGKLTTYRAMAQDVVDRVCRALGAGGRCRTRRIPLGMAGRLEPELDHAAAAADRLGLSPTAGRRLVERYGDDWPAASELIRTDPALGDQVVPGLDVLRVELELARTREMAVTEEDVLVRRTRLATMAPAEAEALSGSGPSRLP
jgi:glycerol-3-phosphate dehydrogenase